MDIFSRSTTSVLAFVGAIVCASFCSGDQSSTTHSEEIRNQVAQLIEQLGDDNFRVRSNAMSALDRIGLPAFEQLRAALEHSNIQVALSAEYLLLSQNVVWWLDSDSYEVRERLQDYSSLSPQDRHTRLQELALIGTDDALMALCRIAKFESDELVSRAASLALLRKLSKLPIVAQATVAKSILLTIDRTDRPATRWLDTYVRQYTFSEVDQQPMPDAQTWKQYAVELILEVSDKPQKISGEQRLQILGYYEWLAEWLGDELSRSELLELMRPSLTLVDESPFALREYGYWALSVNLPELVEESAKKRPSLFESAKSRPDLFETDHELGYLLAEAYRQAKDETRAAAAAEQARGVPKVRSRLLAQLARGGAVEIELAQRATQARRLRDRGLFDWAEAEYVEAAKLDSKDKNLILISLAEIYWEGGKYDLAANILEPVVQEPPPDANLPGALYDFSSLLAHYHWYRALSHADRNEIEPAMEQFRKSIEANDAASVQNPDIVISLFRTAKSDADRQFFQQHFDSMVRHYRSLVAKEETRLAQSNFGQFANAGSDLSEYCNQLAWLLSSCETNVEEALYLSQRSLEYNPEIPAYLDTMARCCLAAGRLEDALKYQTAACSKSPHDRLMKTQLALIEERISSSASQSDPAEPNGN